MTATSISEIKNLTVDELRSKVSREYEEIVKTLIDRKLHITTMESCTGGLLSSLLTDTEGSSNVIKGAFVTYSNEAKVLQGVPKETIDKFGVYSKETALAMARAAKNNLGSDIAIGVTGTMGNVDPVNNDSVPGIVYYAIIIEERESSFNISIDPMDSRQAYKLAVAHAIADSVIGLL
ncbi:CinA family protein [Butyrivibrio proteoclasticus]|uniref:CinA family protein n=1 Tax=Butyrivibrio proteoclasticus TaxID=43305 RepID=UPI0009DD4AF6|nr:CinA family protein [Butyrivibrio proteoclasticus]